MRGLLLWGLIALLFGALGCEAGDDDDANGGNDNVGGSTVGGDDGGGTEDRQHPSSGESWTFLVYMVADTNLEPFGLQDLEEMMAVGSGDGLNIVALVDRASDYTTDGVGGVGDWESAKRMVIRDGALEVEDDLGELNMGDPDVLADFIEWGVKNYPADRHAIIFWDHGGAWPGFGGDESASHDLLNLAELKAGLAAGRERADLEQFALIGFDACLMATLETAIALKSEGEYLLASEELEPGHGWDYRSLSVLAANPGTDPVALGEALIEGFKSQAEEAGEDRTITLSLMDLYALAPLQNAVNAFAAAVEADMNALSANIGRERAKSLAFGEMPDESQSLHQVDLGHFVSNLAEQADSLAGKRDAVLDALGDFVVAHHEGAAMAAGQGLSVYFPPRANYYNEAYNDVEGMGAWRGMLSAYYGEGGNISGGDQPRFLNDNHAAQAEFQANGDLVVAGSLAPGTFSNIAAITLYVGAVDSQSGTIFLLGDLPGQLAADGTAFATWGSAALVMMQGGHKSMGYLNLTVDGDYLKATIPLTYEDPNGNAQYAIVVYVIHNPSGSVVSTTYYLVNGGQVGELSPEPGARIYPQVVAVTSDGQTSWVRVDDTGFDPTEPIAIDVERLPSGTNAYVELDAVDFGGNMDYVAASGALP